ncbi:MAG TPA: YceI family protein [Candidatus Dormibacteraeota bacterium]|jgi:polyisoprenoid-binding protein YceI
MTRKLWLPIAAAAALALLGGAGAYVYFFSGLRTAPPALALASPSASPSTDATPTATTGGAGTWTVASGSLAGYRVTEQFAGQSSTHQAVARTSNVSGQVTITQSSDAYQMSAATITVQLSNLASVDSVAGYNVTNRDRIVQESLDVGSFPTAVFEAQSVSLPAAVATGQTVTVSVPGTLTVHGVTKDVTATLQLRVSGGTAQIAGSISTSMTDFGISPPRAPFVTVQPPVTIEVSLNLTKSA